MFQNGRHCFFEDFPSQQPEKLARKQIETILYETLKRHLTNLGIQPRSIIIHRDGRTFEPERLGVLNAIKRLKREGLLPDDAIVGIVDIRKKSSIPLRIVEERGELLVNPVIGSYYFASTNSRDGFVCDTGWPFELPGTAKPLHAYIVEGELNISWILEDTFALSQLIYAAPDRCARLPLTIKLADDFLEPIAAEANEEKALYGDEDDQADADDDEAATREQGGSEEGIKEATRGDDSDS